MFAQDPAPSEVTVRNPYVGLNYYSEEEANFFFGRETEQKVVIANLRASRLTLLYAVSGVGKSSLLRAGVAAQLWDLAQRDISDRGSARYIPLVLNRWREDPVGRVVNEIAQTVRAFANDDLIVVSPRETLDRVIAEATETLGDATLLIVLDQFEDYLLSTVEEEPPGRLADELTRCINSADLRANFLIFIREDAYSCLGDVFKGRISNVYGNYLHLEYLSRDAAREAITGPIDRLNELHPGEEPYTVDLELIEEVLDQVSVEREIVEPVELGSVATRSGAASADEKIVTPLLQLVMTKLWDREHAMGSRKLRLSTLDKDLRGANEIVRLYVDDALSTLSDQEREAAFDIFRHLVTSRTKIAALRPRSR